MLSHMNDRSKFALAGVMVFCMTVSACSQLSAVKSITPAEGALLSCQDFTVAVEKVTPYVKSGKVNGGTLKDVDKAIDLASSYCLGPSPSVTSSVKDVSVDAATRILNAAVALFI